MVFVIGANGHLDEINVRFNSGENDRRVIWCLAEFPL